MAIAHKGDLSPTTHQSIYHVRTRHLAIHLPPQQTAAAWGRSVSLLGRRRTALHRPCVTLSEHQTGLTCSCGEGFFYLELKVFTKEFSPTLSSWQAVQALDVCLGCSYFLKSNQEACIHPPLHPPRLLLIPSSWEETAKYPHSLSPFPQVCLGQKGTFFIRLVECFATDILL